MPGHSSDAGAIRMQILATEHWSLLATRGLIWSEMSSRAGMFLTTMSAAVVALALVAQATNFGDDFTLFALLILPVVLLVGIWTTMRLSVARHEDVWMVVGMNRLRHAYIDMDPDLEQYFVTSCYDDMAGVMKTYSPTGPSRLVGVLISTSVLVGVINAALVGVIVALIVEFFENSPAVHVGAGAIASLMASIVLVGVIPFRDLDRLERGLDAHFPAPAASPD